VRNAWIQGLSLEDRHTVGINLWKSSFCRWPVVCTLDEEVLRTCLSLPLSSAAGRRLQKELVKRRWPDLAALPLDRNAFHASPLDSDRARGADLWVGRFRHALRKFLGIETRYFHALFEMGTPQWRQVREAMEPGRVPAGSVFQPQALLEALPSPETPFPVFSNGLADTVRIKTLLGAMGWFGENGNVPPG
jgi:asparagine synthase (glutamine-hydrolysing)